MKDKNINILINDSLNYKIPVESALNIFEQNKYAEIFKDDNRSLVAVFYFEGRKLVIKVPREKNRRKWIRFLTLFRKSEAVRNFYELKSVLDNNIITAVPVAAIEKRRSAMLIESFLIYEYLDGKEVEESGYNNVVAKLREIHLMGNVHGDSQIRNFLVCGDAIGIIDARFSKKRFGAFSDSYEMWYLRKSADGIGKYMEDDTKKISFKLVDVIFSVFRIYKNSKKRIIKKLKSGKGTYVKK